MFIFIIILESNQIVARIPNTNTTILHIYLKNKIHFIMFVLKFIASL